MSNLDLLQSYLFSSPYPAVLYRSSSNHQRDQGHGFNLDELPAFVNPAAQTVVGDYPFSHCVATSSQTSLKQAVDEAWRSKQNVHPEKNGGTGSSGRVEITLLQAVSMDRKRSHLTQSSSSTNGLSPVSPRTETSTSRLESPRQDISISGEGNLQIVKWAFSVLPLSSSTSPAPTAGAKNDEGHILVLTGMWAQPGSLSLPALHKAGTFPAAPKGGPTSSMSSMSTPTTGLEEGTAQADTSGHVAGAENRTASSTGSLNGSTRHNEDSGIPEPLVRKAREWNVTLPTPKVASPSASLKLPSLPMRSPGKIEQDRPLVPDAAPLPPPGLLTPGLRNNGEPLDSYYAIEHQPRDQPADLDPVVLARLARNAPIGMVIASTTAKLIWVNEIWYTLTGLKHGDDLDSWIDRVAPEYMSLMLQTVGDLLNTRAVSNVDFMWMDGTWANFTTQCDYDEDGVFVGLVGTLSDATRRKRAELNEIEALRKRETEARKAAEEVEQRNRELAEANVMNQKLQQQRNMLASMAEISPTGLTIAKRDGTLVWANKAFLNIHGLTDGNKQGWAEIVHEDDVGRLQNAWEE